MPASRTAGTAGEIREAARAIGFPVIVKPAEGSAGAGVFVASSSEELELHMPADGAFIVQRMIATEKGSAARGVASHTSGGGLRNSDQ